MLTVADEKGGQLDKRVMIYADELGTLPKIEGIEMMFSASRSRKISIVAIIQSLAQFEKTYGKEGAEIIVDNCQCTLFGAFAPNSKTAEAMSQNLGKQTVLSGRAVLIWKPKNPISVFTDSVTGALKNLPKRTTVS